MAFKLRSQSPIKQVKDKNKQPSLSYPSGKINDKVTTKQSLNKEGDSETKYYRGNFEIGAEESNILRNKDKQKANQKRQDYNRDQPNSTVKSLIDPTGVSQWGEAKLATKDLVSMTGSVLGFKSKKGYDWDNSRALGDVSDIVGAIPLIGKAKAVNEGMKMVKISTKSVIKAIGKKMLSHSIPTAGIIGTNEYNKSKKK